MSAVKKKSALIYYDILEDVLALDTEEIAGLFLAILSTGGGCEMPKLSHTAMAVFRPIRRGIEQNHQRWEETCKARAEAGRKGGKARAESASKSKQSQANQANQADKEKEKDTVKDTDTETDKDVCIIQRAADAAPHTHPSTPSGKQKKSSAQEAEAHFQALWAIWPNKRGKSQVSAEMRRSLLAVSVESMQQAIDNYVREVQESPSDRQLLNGSTWFCGRYLDYLPENYQPRPQIAGTRQEVQQSPRARTLTRYRTPEEIASRAAWLARIEE